MEMDSGQRYMMGWCLIAVDLTGPFSFHWKTSTQPGATMSTL